MTHSTTSLASLHLTSIFLLLISTTKNYKSRPFKCLWVDAARQGPAFGVIPVFIPDQPSFSILFVFYHLKMQSSSTSSNSFLHKIGGL